MCLITSWSISFTEAVPNAGLVHGKHLTSHMEGIITIV